MKNTFKKKSLYAAMLVGMGAIGAAGTANAVYVSPDGTGQVLVYPFYTVNGPTGATQLTGFSVTNTGASAKLVKVRFRESKNSREVLDFNVYLSPYDMWTGAVSGDGIGAKVSTGDKSCTDPAIPAAGVAFRNSAYTNSQPGDPTANSGEDGAGTGLDRTSEGYFEMIELGNLSNATQAAWVTHGAGGAAPANCAAIVAANNAHGTGSDSGIATNHVFLSAPTNELFGEAAIINVTTGLDVTYDATAFADFSTFSIDSGIPLGNEAPNFADGDDTSTVFHSTAGGTQAVTSDWTGTLPDGGVNAMSATIMHSSVMNEYVLNASTLSSTDWVVTFPTKRYYVQSNNMALTGGTINGIVYAPFQRTFWNGACDDVTISYWDREEYANQSTVDFSPRTTSTNSLCWEANVVTFNNGNYLSSPNSKSIDVGSRENGWAKIDFRNVAGNGDSLVSTGIGETPTAVPHTYTGLPVIGFMVQDYINNQTGINASYGGNFTHKWQTTVAP